MSATRARRRMCGPGIASSWEVPVSAVEVVTSEFGGGAPPGVGVEGRTTLEGDGSTPVRTSFPPGAAPEVSTLKLRFKLNVETPG